MIFNKIQEEINLLVRQAILVTQLEEKHLILTKEGDLLFAKKVRLQLDSIYPYYIKLREKYITKE